MNGARGQALVELALVAPALLILVLGAVAVDRVADARSGLDAATSAAALAAARQSTSAGAMSAGQSAFAGVVAAYPVQSPSVTLTTGTFSRGSRVIAQGNGTVDLGFVPVPGLPSALVLRAVAAVTVEPYRGR